LMRASVDGARGGAGSRGATRERRKHGAGGGELPRTVAAHATRNMLKEYASQTRWSKVQPTTAPPHPNLVTCARACAMQAKS
jgi:hypothetical protein